jgi:hypothetical protein
MVHHETNGRRDDNYEPPAQKSWLGSGARLDPGHTGVVAKNLGADSRSHRDDVCLRHGRPERFNERGFVDRGTEKGMHLRNQEISDFAQIGRIQRRRSSAEHPHRSLGGGDASERRPLQQLDQALSCDAAYIQRALKGARGGSIRRSAPWLHLVLP